MIKIFSLKNKVAVVAGGAGLIGKAVSIGLAKAGANVYVADIDEKEGKKIENDKIKWIKLDITDEKSINSCIDQILKKDKKINIWVNAAYPHTKDWSNKFEDVKYESWRKNVDMHMSGYFLCCQQIAKQMKKQKQGSIINFSSIYGVIAPDFSIYEGTNSTMPAAYSAIKGGIVMLTKYLSTYYARYGVRVNTICPGGIYNKQPKSFVKKYEEKTPLGRMGKPEDLVGPVVFLASDSSSYITGQTLLVDGGWTVW